MILSKTSEYSLRILSFMTQETYPLYTATLLQKELDIPYRYLRKLLTRLAKSGYIIGSKGRNGGYVFKKKPEEIYLSDIIDVVEGFESFKSCLLGNYQCDQKNPCPMHLIWAETKEKIIKVFTTTSLADLKNKSIESI